MDSWKREIKSWLLTARFWIPTSRTSRLSTSCSRPGERSSWLWPEVRAPLIRLLRLLSLLFYYIVLRNLYLFFLQVIALVTILRYLLIKLFFIASFALSKDHWTVGVHLCFCLNLSSLIFLLENRKGGWGSLFLANVGA